MNTILSSLFSLFPLSFIFFLCLVLYFSKFVLALKLSDLIVICLLFTVCIPLSRGIKIRTGFLFSLIHEHTEATAHRISDSHLSPSLRLCSLSSEHLAAIFCRHYFASRTQQNDGAAFVICSVYAYNIFILFSPSVTYALFSLTRDHF